jgi:hypothetical protein
MLPQPRLLANQFRRHASSRRVRIDCSPPTSPGISQFSAKKPKIFAFIRAFSCSRDSEKRPNSHHCEQIRRLISAGSEAGSFQIISQRTLDQDAPSPATPRKMLGELGPYRILLRRCCERYNWRTTFA